MLSKMRSLFIILLNLYHHWISENENEKKNISYLPTILIEKKTITNN